MLAFALFTAIVAITMAQENTILKQEDDNQQGVVVDVKAKASHKFISKDSPTKIAVLFDVTTSSDANNKDSQKPRSPYELAIVLDRSGSMAGDKIEQAKLAMLGIVDNMIDGDIIHLIQYDYTAEVFIHNFPCHVLFPNSNIFFCEFAFNKLN